MLFYFTFNLLFVTCTSFYVYFTCCCILHLFIYFSLVNMLFHFVLILSYFIVHYVSTFTLIMPKRLCFGCLFQGLLVARVLGNARSGCAFPKGAGKTWGYLWRLLRGETWFGPWDWFEIIWFWGFRLRC